jgi:hypothetical protein
MKTSLALCAPVEGLYGKNGLKVMEQTDYLILHVDAVPAIDRSLVERGPDAAPAAWEEAARDLLAQGVGSGVVIYSAERGLCAWRDQVSCWHDFAGSARPSSGLPLPAYSSAAGFLTSVLSDRYDRVMFSDRSQSEPSCSSE